MNQKFIIERVIIDVVCSSRCPVNSFTDICFTVVVYGENPFWAAGGFFAAIPRVAAGKNWLQGWAAAPYTALIIYSCLSHQLPVSSGVTSQCLRCLSHSLHHQPPLVGARLYVPLCLLPLFLFSLRWFQLSFHPCLRRLHKIPVHMHPFIPSSLPLPFLQPLSATPLLLLIFLP